MDIPAKDQEKGTVYSDVFTNKSDAISFVFSFVLNCLDDTCCGELVEDGFFDAHEVFADKDYSEKYNYLKYDASLEIKQAVIDIYFKYWNDFDGATFYSVNKHEIHG